MLATARRYFPSDSRAEDMVQDALLRLWEIKETLREPINGIANILVRNIAVDTLRREKPTVDIDGMEIGTPSNANDVHERYNKVMTIIDQMPQAQQTIIRLRLIDGMEYAKNLQAHRNKRGYNPTNNKPGTNGNKTSIQKEQ